MARITMREAISQAIWEEMERDPRVFIMGEEVGVWGGTYAVTKGFYDHFGGERVRDTPIAEAAIIGGAIGAALTGLRPWKLLNQKSTLTEIWRPILPWFPHRPRKWRREKSPRLFCSTSMTLKI